MDRAGKLADRAVSLGDGHPFLPYFQVAAALAAYRRGEFQTSIERCDKALNDKVTVAITENTQEALEDPYRDLHAHYIRAMALARLGKRAEAKQTRDKASAMIQELRKERGKNSYAWHDWAICEMLEQEAERTLAEPANTKPAP